VSARQWARELWTDLRDAHRLGREFHAESMALLRTWLRLSLTRSGRHSVAQISPG
jgi:hypothetical protein